MRVRARARTNKHSCTPYIHDKHKHSHPQLPVSIHMWNIDLKKTNTKNNICSVFGVGKNKRQTTKKQKQKKQTKKNNKKRNKTITANENSNGNKTESNKSSLHTFVTATSNNIIF